MRVIKTAKQTADVDLGYMGTAADISASDGVSGLMLRGLGTKIVSNGVQACHTHTPIDTRACVPFSRIPPIAHTPARDAPRSVLSLTPSFTPQAMLFTVCWRYLEEKMAERSRKAKAA